MPPVSVVLLLIFSVEMTFTHTHKAYNVFFRCCCFSLCAFIRYSCRINKWHSRAQWMNKRIKFSCCCWSSLRSLTPLGWCRFTNSSFYFVLIFFALLLADFIFPVFFSGDIVHSSQPCSSSTFFSLVISPLSDSSSSSLSFSLRFLFLSVGIASFQCRTLFRSSSFFSFCIVDFCRMISLLAFAGSHFFSLDVISFNVFGVFVALTLKPWFRLTNRIKIRFSLWFFFRFLFVCKLEFRLFLSAMATIATQMKWQSWSQFRYCDKREQSREKEGKKTEIKVNAKGHRRKENHFVDKNRTIPWFDYLILSLLSIEKEKILKNLRWRRKRWCFDVGHDIVYNAFFGVGREASWSLAVTGRNAKLNWNHFM